MKRVLMLFVLTAFIGCCSRSSVKPQIVRGWVRNVWYKTAHGGNMCYDVTVEKDDGTLVVFSFSNQPAVWAGMHAEISFTNDVSCGYETTAIKRLLE